MAYLPATPGPPVLAAGQHDGYPGDVEWILDRHRHPGEPVCVVQARLVTVATAAAAEPASTDWNPAAMATFRS